MKEENLQGKYFCITDPKDVNTVINDGDVISIIGPSGTGKSTLIRCINMLERPTKGKILFNGVDITKYNLEDVAIIALPEYKTYDTNATLNNLDEMITLAIKDFKNRSRKIYSFDSNILSNYGVKGLKGKLK